MNGCWTKATPKSRVLGPGEHELLCGYSLLVTQAMSLSGVFTLLQHPLCSCVFGAVEHDGRLAKVGLTFRFSSYILFNC
jgi:hypothetical protein